jgi:hypothetical protein
VYVCMCVDGVCVCVSVVYGVVATPEGKRIGPCRPLQRDLIFKCSFHIEVRNILVSFLCIIAPRALPCILPPVCVDVCVHVWMLYLYLCTFGCVCVNFLRTLDMCGGVVSLAFVVVYALFVLAMVPSFVVLSVN